MMGLGKSKLRSKFEVASTAVAEILKVKPQILQKLTSSGPHRLFRLGGFDDGPWQTAAA